MLQKFLTIVVTVLLSWNHFASAEEPDVQVTHGGDAYTAEFLKIYADLRLFIFESSIALPTGIEISVFKLDAVRAKLMVESQPVLFRDGKEVSAINTPAKYLIQLSQKHWSQISHQQKELLILHEVLPLLGFVDDEYKHSAAWALYFEARKGDFSDSKKMGRSVLQCDPQFISRLNQGLYDIFTAESKAEYLMLAAFGACSRYFDAAIRFSSKQAVKSSCETGSNGATPLSLFLKFLGKNALNYDLNFNGASAVQATFNLLYEGPQDRMQKCEESGMTFTRDICQVIAENEPRFNPALQSFAHQIGCP